MKNKLEQQIRTAILEEVTYIDGVKWQDPCDEEIPRCGGYYCDDKWQNIKYKFIRMEGKF